MRQEVAFVYERFSELRCKEVINLPDGCRLGYVSDLVLDTGSGAVLALVVPSCERLLGLLPGSGEFVIPWTCIRRIGGDLILVDACLDECRRRREKNKPKP